MRKFVLFIFISFLTGQAPPSFTLKEVNIEGNQATSDNMILYTSGLKNGQKASTEDFRRAVKRLWELGVFSNIDIHFDGETPDGILITIEVEESPVLGEVIFKGNKKLKDKKLKEELSYHRGMRIKPNFTTKMINQIKNLYMEDGYFLAEITAESKIIGKGEDQKNDIIFNIIEGKKLKIKDIVISGHENNFGWLATKSWIPLPKSVKKKLSLSKLRWQLKDTKIRTWWRFWASPYDS